MRRLVSEPLLHFAVLGALLFAGYGWLNGSALDAPDAIVVSRERIAAIEAQFEAVWRRAPTAAERDALVEAWIREEVLVREGLAMGLDRDDPVVRRRVAQKVAFLTDGAASDEPSEADLQQWLDAHAGDYRVEPTYTLRQVYFDPARRGARLDADVATARAALARDADAPLGDPTLLPASLEAAPPSELARVFGDDFAAGVSALPVGGWEPLRSSYGVHLVLVRASTPARTPALQEVRAAVERDWSRARSDAAEEAFYQSLRQRYEVRIEGDGESAGDASLARAQ